MAAAIGSHGTCIVWRLRRPQAIARGARQAGCPDTSSVSGYRYTKAWVCDNFPGYFSRMAFATSLASPEASLPLGRDARHPSEVLMAGGKLLVLVVGRDPHVCELETHFLNSAGFGVQFANDGNVALAQAKSLQPDLVITENPRGPLGWIGALPATEGRSGDRTYQRIGVQHPSSRARAMEAGADALLIKPLAEHRLVRTVEELLEKRAGRQEAQL